uniref:Glycolipid transfer protein domain-containing protein n=1 Tax=Pongo abelii TaxID=9601 RepID=H2NDZ3_PONAB
MKTYQKKGCDGPGADGGGRGVRCGRPRCRLGHHHGPRPRNGAAGRTPAEAAAGRQADQDRALPQGGVPPAALLRLPWVPSVYSHQGRHKRQHHENQSCVRHQPSQVPDPAEHPGGGERNVFLQSICDEERDENHPNLIRVNATKAYEMALKKYHGWTVQKIFQAALYAASCKSDFLKALSKGQNVTEEECLEKIPLFLVNYTATIDVIYETYTQMNAELNYKV